MFKLMVIALVCWSLIESGADTGFVTVIMGMALCIELLCEIVSQRWIGQR